MIDVIGLKAVLLDAKGKVRSKAGLAQPPARLTTRYCQRRGGREAGGHTPLEVDILG